ncbi:DUF1016 N-terminal domain-containing protein [Burkholderia sp. NLJ2]|uniref:DUF1016 N-terminal domain-containing protein n=1 Tax=Burkholderia sp. NLJ2 TaxID=3090699 RepID=UPI003C6C45E7
MIVGMCGRDGAHGGMIRTGKDDGLGGKVIERLALALETTFPGMKGSSRTDLMSMRAFADAWPDAAIVQQAVGQLPRGHNPVLLVKLEHPEQHLAYAQRLRYA